MVDYNILVPFILKAEGGYVNNSSDKGGETNKGITWATWVTFFGDTSASHNKFLVMDSLDWGLVFKKGFVDKCLGDLIVSQKIFNVYIDWCWGSGFYYPTKHLQTVLGVTADGIIGQHTISALNSFDESKLYDALCNARIEYYKNIVANDDAKGDFSQDKFLQGWENRVINLEKFNENFILN